MIISAGFRQGFNILLFGTKEGPFTADGNRLSDSFCGTLSASSGLYRWKIPFQFAGIVFPEESDFKKKIENFGRTCLAVDGFFSARKVRLGQDLCRLKHAQ